MAEYWLGLDKDGNQISISHSKLMEWAFDNDKQFTIGWSNSIEMDDGKRLVRGPDKVNEARKKGWNDLADMLEKFLKEQEITNANP